MQTNQIITILVFGVLVLIVVGLGVWFYQRYRQQQWRVLMSLGPLPNRHNSLRNYPKGRFWLRSLYNPFLPNISRYGGKQDLQGTHILATEYPRAVEVNTEPLQRPRYVVQQPILSGQAAQLLSLLRTLCQSEGYYIFPHYPLSYVISVIHDSSSAIHEQRLQHKTIDFVLCDHTLQVQGAILLEAENRAEQKPKQQIAARLIESLLSAVDIPVLFLAHSEQYSAAQLQRLLLSQLQLKLPERPTCPECGALMKKTRVKSGPHAGKYFLVCSHYPHCRTIQPLQKIQIS